MKNFILIGAAGFVAPRHMEAIKETGNDLIACFDPCDSVGIIDSYFPDCNFFTEFEIFERHCERIKRDGTAIDYVSICSPNYLHDSHCRFGLRLGADVICEKPLTIKHHNLDALAEFEESSMGSISTILQLRLLDEIKALNENINLSSIYSVKINYCTPRGEWYKHSWKSNARKSGGLIMNIGIHFIDLIIMLFGRVSFENLNMSENTIDMTLKNDSVVAECHFSIDRTRAVSKEMLINGDRIDLNKDFTNMHTKCYREILSGNSFGIKDVYDSIKLCNKIYRVGDKNEN